MPTFRYRAKDASGEKIEGVMDADSRANAIARLQSMNYFPVSVEEEAQKSRRRFSLFGDRIRSNDLCELYRQLADLITAGIALVKSLQIVVNQTPSPALRQVIAEVTSDVQGGDTFAEALEKHPRVFPPLATALIHSGERGGFLPEVFEQLATFAEMEEELKGKVRSALAYPVVMVFVGAAAVIFLMTFVMPKVITMYEDMNQDLPAITEALIFFSGALRERWYLFALGALALGVVAWRLMKSREGHRALHRLQLRLPVLGPIMLKREISRFTRTLGQMLHNGVPILTSLEIVSGVISNDVVRAAIDSAPPEITQGGGLSGALNKSGVFPPGIVNMIAIGEETGRLPEVLQRIAPSYEAQVDRSLKSLTSLIEPLIILAMGLVVGFIVIAMLLPILTLDPTNIGG